MHFCCIRKYFCVVFHACDIISKDLTRRETMKYTLDMDFSALEGAMAVNWVDRFQDILEDAFSGSG